MYLIYKLLMFTKKKQILVTKHSRNYIVPIQHCCSIIQPLRSFQKGSSSYIFSSGKEILTVDLAGEKNDFYYK